MKSKIGIHGIDIFLRPISKKKLLKDKWCAVMDMLIECSQQNEYIWTKREVDILNDLWMNEIRFETPYE